MPVHQAFSPAPVRMMARTSSWPRRKLPQVLQLFAHLYVECVEHFGAIERDDCNAVVLFVQESFVIGHSRSLGRPGGTANLADLDSGEHLTCAGERQAPLNRSNRRTSVASSASAPTISSTSPSSAARVAVIAFDGPEQRKPIDLRLGKRATQPSSMNRRKTARHCRFADHAYRSWRSPCRRRPRAAMHSRRRRHEVRRRTA